MITLRKKIGLCSLITLLVNGCSYQANINSELIKHSNQPHIYVNEAIKLVDDRSDILDVSISSLYHTFQFSVKDAYFIAVRDVLKQSVEVNVSPSKPLNGLYIVPHFNTSLSYLGSLGAGLETLTRIDLFDAERNSLLKSYQINNHLDYQLPGSALALNFLTGFTLFTLSPITLPAATNIMGEHGKDLLEHSISDSLNKFGNDFRDDLVKRSKLKEEFRLIDSCFNAIKIDPALSSISNKVALSSTQDQSFEMLANREKPANNEKNAIKYWRESRLTCFSKMEAYQRQNNTANELIALNSTAKSVQDELIIQLYQGSLTYGDFARKRQAIADSTMVAEMQINNEIAKQNLLERQRLEEVTLKQKQVQLQEAQTREMQQQTLMMGIQAITQQSMQQQQLNNQQQIINRLNMPQHTNCNVLGNNVSCTNW